MRFHPMPPTGLSLVLLASVVAFAPRVYSASHARRNDQIPGLTYERQPDAPHAPIALVVTSVQDGSAAAKADIMAGDVIDRIDGKPIPSISAVGRAVHSDAAKGIVLHIRHAGESRYKHLPAARAVDSGTLHVAQDTRRRR